VKRCGLRQVRCRGLRSGASSQAVSVVSPLERMGRGVELHKARFSYARLATGAAGSAVCPNKGLSDSDSLGRDPKQAGVPCPPVTQPGSSKELDAVNPSTTKD
jgi:hypothetical protein